MLLTILTDFSSGTSLHEYETLKCAARMSEIWVPTEWCRDVITNMMRNIGIPTPRIAVIPEAVDTTLFSPEFYNTKVTHDYSSLRIVHLNFGYLG